MDAVLLRITVEVEDVTFRIRSLFGVLARGA